MIAFPTLYIYIYKADSCHYIFMYAVVTADSSYEQEHKITSINSCGIYARVGTVVSTSAEETE